MGNWKTKYKVGDLAFEQKIELICQKCKRVVYTDRKMLCEDADRSQKYLDEIERAAYCKVNRCRGRMRLSLVRLQEMSGFVGGLA